MTKRRIAMAGAGSHCVWLWEASGSACLCRGHALNRRKMMNRICTILITGAGSGLGRGLSLHFAAGGHRIIAADLKVETVKKTISLMGAAATTSHAHELDVASESSRQAFFQAIADEQVDVLVNNAGIQHVARLEEFPQPKWEQLVDVILNGPAAMTRAVLPGMRQRGHGRIVNIGSASSLVASAYKSAYVAAKHGLLGFSKTIALETGDVDITINTICPSYIRTPLVEAQLASQAKVHKMSEEEVIQRIMLEPMPKKVFITYAEIAGAIEFLMSPAARNVTGTTISIDGGWTAR